MLQDEIMKLRSQLPGLEARLDYLRAKLAGQKTPAEKSVLVNSSMPEFTFTQELAIARMYSAISQFSLGLPRMLPLDRSIYLPKGVSSRIMLLSSLQNELLREAARIMKERTSFIELDMLPVCEESSYMTPEGHACMYEFAVDQLEDATSVNGAYVAAQETLLKLDEHIMDVTGDCIFCEALDAFSELQKRNINHQRRLCSDPGGLLVETNGVYYGEYPARDLTSESEAAATILLHTIESDALYPYQADQQLRLDVASIISLQKRRQTVPVGMRSTVSRLLGVVS